MLDLLNLPLLLLIVVVCGGGTGSFAFIPDVVAGRGSGDVTVLPRMKKKHTCMPRCYIHSLPLPSLSPSFVTVKVAFAVSIGGGQFALLGLGHWYGRRCSQVRGKVVLLNFNQLVTWRSLNDLHLNRLSNLTTVPLKHNRP